eukprot:TRINITY_DN37118_c0_g1_i1.p1 TRINITY_DN37118_c0_g1~~TRINITY_DN37118_c0_g1_i1.p1  ORF type:complete len:133 (-),score=21.81 TRINITY_DN37118_c0_g1_i1:54-452(-)
MTKRPRRSPGTGRWRSSAGTSPESGDRPSGGLSGPPPGAAVLVDEFEHQRADVVAPGLAGENAVMPRAGLKMRRLLVVGQAGQQIQCRKALSRPRDIVLLALNDLDGDGCDKKKKKKNKKNKKSISLDETTR